MMFAERLNMCKLNSMTPKYEWGLWPIIIYTAYVSSSIITKITPYFCNLTKIIRHIPVLVAEIHVQAFF